MAMTKEQWDQVEEEMRGQLGRVVLSLEGRELVLKKMFVKENQLAIVVFIDGEIQPACGFPSMECFDAFTQKVWRKSRVSLFKPSRKARIIKELGKRLAKQTFPDLDEKREYWVPEFRTAASMRRALHKNKEMELVHIGFKTETA
ncbi:hypothetical protein [Marinobacterium stanieri]|uniref:hypothetical protein n=1 Tax=Marinobacterium stanieri TaxID=49186 RepID=UPI0002558853|nr:hypothetical protein [Marinobacterium stanieri]